MSATKFSSVSLLVLVAGAFLIYGAAQAKARPQNSPAVPAKQANAASAGSVENGKRLYIASGCFECHGREGQGAVTGPRIALTPRPLASFEGYIRQPKGEMPPYTEKVVPDSDAADIFAFLRSLPPPAKPDSIPLLK